VFSKFGFKLSIFSHLRVLPLPDLSTASCKPSSQVPTVTFVDNLDAVLSPVSFSSVFDRVPEVGVRHLEERIVFFIARIGVVRAVEQVFCEDDILSQVIREVLCMESVSRGFNIGLDVRKATSTKRCCNAPRLYIGLAIALKSS
jgi:hypothetical protein